VTELWAAARQAAAPPQEVCPTTTTEKEVAVHVSGGRGVHTVLDGELVDGVGEDGERGVVIEVELVCDVAVDEDVAGLACKDNALWDA